MDTQFIILYLLLIFIFWVFFVSPYLVASTRRKLFSIRAQVFLDFEHDDDYQRFRERINLLIRFADRLSWQRMLVDFIMFNKELKQSSDINFNNEKLNELFLISIISIIRLIILRSPTLILLSMPFFVIALIQVEVLPRVKDIISNFVVKDAQYFANIQDTRTL